MRLVEVSDPIPGKGEVLVKVHAATINPVDWKVRNGQMAMMTGRNFPRAMGMEFAGVVESLGAGVSTLSQGDEVFGTVTLKSAGAFAEKVVTSEKLVAKKPSELSFEQASALCVAPVAAWRGLIDKGSLKSGQRVFIAGCMGAVGSAAVAIARNLGAVVEGSCSQSDFQAAQAMGVSAVYDYKKNLPLSLSKRYDLVFDTAGQLPISEGLSLLCCRNSKFLDINFTPARMLRGLLNPRYKVVMGTPSQEVFDALAEMVSRSKIQIRIGETSLLDEAISLIQRTESGQTSKGRSVIMMSSDSSISKK